MRLSLGGGDLRLCACRDSVVESPSGRTFERTGTTRMGGPWLPSPFDNEDVISPAETGEPRDSPRFGVALVAVLAAAVFTSWCSTQLPGLFIQLGRDMRYILISFLGALVVKLVLRIIGYEISYLITVVALLVGAAVAIMARGFILSVFGPSLVPSWFGFRALAMLPGLLVSALVVQHAAAPAPRWRDLVFRRKRRTTPAAGEAPFSGAR
jgi:hypothetical protein